MLTPILLVGFDPKPAPGSGLPLLVQPTENIGSGRVDSRDGRCRMASYRFCAARISGLFFNASAISEPSDLRCERQAQSENYKQTNSNLLHLDDKSNGQGRRARCEAGKLVRVSSGESGEFQMLGRSRARPARAQNTVTSAGAAAGAVTATGSALTKFFKTSVVQVGNRRGTLAATMRRFLRKRKQ